jgi:hypothetical protein
LPDFLGSAVVLVGQTKETTPRILLSSSRLISPAIGGVAAAVLAEGVEEVLSCAAAVHHIPTANMAVIVTTHTARCRKTFIIVPLLSITWPALPMRAFLSLKLKQKKCFSEYLQIIPINFTPFNSHYRGVV